MTTLREAAQQALEALEHGQHTLKQISEYEWESRGVLAMNALHAALADPVNAGMARDDIIRLADEAGFVVDEKARQHQPNCIFHTHHMIDDGLTRFAALVAEREREACAKLCDELRDEDGFEPYGTECAAAIRARSGI
ncbi:hypothetical protein EBT31_00345 [bacterium]|nr:hypothetical protein [bacterium]NBX49711.1 hypothetical protein [bacterium]